jgi:hypothetical protein
VLHPTFSRSQRRGAWHGGELGTNPLRNGIPETTRVARAGVTARGPGPHGSKSALEFVRLSLISHVRTCRALAARAGGLRRSHVRNGKKDRVGGTPQPSGVPTTLGSRRALNMLRMANQQAEQSPSGGTSGARGGAFNAVKSGGSSTRERFAKMSDYQVIVATERGDMASASTRWHSMTPEERSAAADQQRRVSASPGNVVTPFGAINSQFRV